MTDLPTAQAPSTTNLTGRPTVSLEVSSCCAYPSFSYNVYGSCGGVKAAANKVEWKYFKPAEAPEQKLIREPLFNQDNKPAYCGEQLKWYEESWTPPPEDADGFAATSRYFYDMLYRVMREGGKLEITPAQVRQQAAIVQLCQKQNPQIYTRWAKKSRA